MLEVRKSLSVYVNAVKFERKRLKNSGKVGILSTQSLINLSDRVPTYMVATETHNLSIDEYIALTTEAWSAIPLKVKAAHPGVVAKCWHIGPCMLTEFEIAPFRFETKRFHLQNRGELLILRKYKSGFEYGDYDEGEFLGGPGAIHFGDPFSTGKSIASPLTIQEVYVPRGPVGLPVSSPVQRGKIHENTGIGKIVHSEWDSIFRLAQSGTGEVPKPTMDRFLSGIKIALGVHPQREDVRAQARELLFRQIERFIFSNARRSDLNSKAILDQFGVSRASLYRMFEPLGGVRTYLTKLRTSKALIDIWQDQTLRGSVQAARERWGFHTGNDFNRTVTRLFGNSPRRLLTPGQPVHPQLDADSNFAFQFVDLRFASGVPAIAA